MASVPWARVPGGVPGGLPGACGLLLAALLGGASGLRADEAPKPPAPLLTVPLAAVVGAPERIRVRGLRLEGVTEVRSMTPGVAAMLLSQGKAGLPNGVPAERAGDTQLEIEIRFTADLPTPPPSDAVLRLLAPHGEAPLRLPLLAPDRGLVEVEPNPGFTKAQVVAVPADGGRSILGQIERPQDVDVFRIEAGEGRRIRVAVAAGALGSVLDPIVGLHGAAGSPIATADDAGDSRDPILEFAPSPPGPLFLVVQDANDAGGEAHPYLLSVESVAVAAPGDAAASVSFVRDVAPILGRHCVACHGGEKSEGSWRADSFAALLRAGASGSAGFIAADRAGSEGFVRLTTSDPDLRMPLHGEALPAADIDAIGRWIDAGLPFDGVSAEGLLVDEMPPPIHPPAPASYAAAPPVTALAFGPTGELLVGGWGEILVVDPVSGAVRRRIGNVAERSSRIVVHPDGDRFAVAGGVPGRLGEVRIFTLDGRLLRVLARGADLVHDVAWSPAGDRLAVASSDATVRIFDTAGGSLVRGIAGHRDWVLAVAWSPDGSRLASGSRDRTAKVFDTSAGMLLATYGRHDAPVRGLLFAPGGGELISVSDSRKWDRWKIADAAHVRDTHLGGEVLQIVSAGEYFAVPSADGKAHLFRLSDSERVREYDPGAAGRSISVAANVSADLLAAGTQDGRVVVWRLSTGERLAAFPVRP